MESPEAKTVPVIPTNTQQLLDELEQLGKRITFGEKRDLDRAEQAMVIKGK